MSALKEGLREVDQLLTQQIDNSQYDPHQSHNERREIRRKYRKLTETIAEKRRELSRQDDGDTLYHYLDKANVLFADVRNVQEAVLDSKLLTITSDINSQKARNIKLGTENEVNIDKVVQKVITASKRGLHHVEDERLDWEYIGKTACIFGKRAHTMDFLLGPLAVEHKQNKRGKVNRLVKNKEDLVTPARLEEGDIQKQENETSNNVNNIYRILAEIGPINYFKFVTNPESFSQTVENIFYVSFLTRNSVVNIDTTSGQPILSVKNAPNIQSVEDIVEKKQVIMGISIEDWQNIIETYKIDTSIIPTRQNKANAASDKGWY
ncbi:Nse4 C-terminal-domain-containing protein [Mycotypha africana]|uniref:Nse4 C-terminal-domain-containing protein n=1 Tax=Mycotypha africana TaxID=64632 RepID=UPI0023004062|nr:Nse4 C-terminal-domain-containing protein [Mycotypha africana]KAI8988376.1 Nse4 C-terminal-domain-containing protein [Mycotypha africana]